MDSEINDLPALICVDWGGSNFRAFLLNSDSEVLDTVSANTGVLSLHPNEMEEVLYHHINPWLKFDKLAIIMCGMIGSQKGWCETSYIDCPVKASQLAQSIVKVENKKNLDIYITPGVKGRSVFGQVDLMRGEEIQVFGGLNLMQKSGDRSGNSVPQLICLPGTHSKWVQVDTSNGSNPCILNCSTFMTGELFDVLDRHSILRSATSLDEPRVINPEVFKKGLIQARSSGGGMLHQLFSVRTTMLINEIQEADASSFLSGLLIGIEVMETLYESDALSTVCLIGSKQLNDLYQEVIEMLSVPTKVVCIEGYQASYLGMFALAEQEGLIKY